MATIAQSEEQRIGKLYTAYRFLRVRQVWLPFRSIAMIPAFEIFSVTNFFGLVEGKKSLPLRSTFQFMCHKVHEKHNRWVKAFPCIDSGLKFDLNRIICADISLAIHFGDSALQTDGKFQ